jgi:hypothetical protein
VALAGLIVVVAAGVWRRGNQITFAEKLYALLRSMHYMVEIC